MDDKTKNKIDKMRQNFIEGSGRIAVSLLGMLNRVCGQIYGLLFLSPQPLSLDDIVEQLGVSKGNVSINIRVLEDFGLVRKVWIKGSRRDHYEAVVAIPDKILREFFVKIHRNIQDSLDMVKDCQEMAIDIKTVLENDNSGSVKLIVDRMEILRTFYEAANRVFESIYNGDKLDTSILKPFLKH